MKEKLITLFGKEKLLDILKHPEANPRETVLFMGIIIIAVFMLLTIIAIFAVKAPEREKRKLTLKDYLVIMEITGVIILLLVSAGLTYTSTPSFCKTCHVVREEYKMWKKSPHKNVGCLACHQRPGALGFLARKAELARETVLYITKSYQSPIVGEVTNTACYRCHKGIEDKDVVRYTIKVSHKEFLARGDKCTNCHNTVAHGKAVPQEKYPHMDSCVVCHNDKNASSKCETCHIEDIGTRPREEMDYPKVHLGEEVVNCYKCHDPKPCTDCHGTVMPHSEKFVEAWHAREAAYAKKEICGRCHTKQFCNDCHNFPEHPPDWPATHGTLGADWCIQCHNKSQYYFCDLCHGKLPADYTIIPKK